MKDDVQQARSIVLLSGGMDSCVCANEAAQRYGPEQVAALHISYGQRTEERERQAFVAISERLGIRNRMMLRNEAFRAIGGSALTDENIAVPEFGEIGAGI